MVKVTIESDERVETYEGNCFCGFLMNYKYDKVDSTNIVCGEFDYHNAVQSLLNLWKIHLEERANGNKDLKEMLRKCLMLRIRTLDLDGGKDLKR